MSETCTGCGSPNCSWLWPHQKKCCPDCSHTENLYGARLASAEAVIAAAKEMRVFDSCSHEAFDEALEAYELKKERL